MSKAIVLLSGGQDSTTVFSPADGYWLSGLIDGEGCFHVAKRTWESGRENYQPRFTLSLRDDDAEILREVAALTSLGVVSWKRTAHRLGHPTMSWCIWRKADCAGLVALLDRYPLRTKKARDFALWREIISCWLSFKPTPRRPGGRGFEPADWTEIARLDQALREVRRHPTDREAAAA